MEQAKPRTKRPRILPGDCPRCGCQLSAETGERGWFGRVEVECHHCGERHYLPADAQPE